MKKFTLVYRTWLLMVVLLGIHVRLNAQAKKVDCIGFTVADMDRSVRFYHELLSFEKISDEEYYGADFENLENVFGLHIRVVQMQLGNEIIELTDYLTSGGMPVPADAKSNDLSFQHIAIVVSNMEQAYQRLKSFHVEYVSTIPQTIPVSNKIASGIQAFYFHDPDQHNLELIYFPQGKGDSKWQQYRNKLFLGIDHTAIGVSSTEKSLKFYGDILGLELKGESYNYGTAQEHLNNIEGASLHISGLRAAIGPGIEFLEYLKPGPGKPFPDGTKSDDIINWQTTITVNDLTAVTKKLKDNGNIFVSRGNIEMTSKQGISYLSAIVKDPDGHQVVLKSNENMKAGSVHQD